MEYQREEHPKNKLILYFPLIIITLPHKTLSPLIQPTKLRGFLENLTHTINQKSTKEYSLTLNQINAWTKKLITLKSICTFICTSYTFVGQYQIVLTNTSSVIKVKSLGRLWRFDFWITGSLTKVGRKPHWGKIHHSRKLKEWNFL